MPRTVVIHSPIAWPWVPSVQIAGVELKIPHIDVPSKFARGTPIRISTTSRTPTMFAITR